MRGVSEFLDILRRVPRWDDRFVQYGIKVSFWGSGYPGVLATKVGYFEVSNLLTCPRGGGQMGFRVQSLFEPMGTTRNSLAAHAAIDQPEKDGTTLLCAASQQGCRGCVQLLLAAQASNY